jgi:hypothetical protein
MAGVVAVLPAIAPAAERSGDQKLSIAGHETLFLAGPYTHGDLSVYIFYRQQAPEARRQYITLEEGLRNGLVKITERPHEAVASLQITNDSDVSLFLQVGQLLQGGRQDRTLGVSLVVPPHAQDLAIPAFCVEASRWHGGKVFAPQGVFAPRSIRQAMADNDQKQVWNEVKDYKSQAAAGVARANQSEAESSKSSSINEQLEGRPYRLAVGGYENDLSGAIDKVDNPVGMAYAIGSQFSTADIYTSSELFRKLYPMLLRTAASEALAASPVKHFEPPSPSQVADAILAAWQGTHTKNELPADNVLLRMRGGDALASQLFYKRDLVHTEAISTAKPVAPEPPDIQPAPPIEPMPPIIQPKPRPSIRPEPPSDLDELWKAHY